MLKIETVSFAYKKKFESDKLIDRIDFQVGQSEVVGLIGSMGCGKSTLAKICGGILSPEKGKVKLNGTSIYGSKNKIKGKIGLLFQYPEDQIFEETVFDDIAFAPRNLGFNKEIKEVVDKSADVVGLNKDLYYRSPFTLSGGELRKVAIAGIIAMDPQLLILDEPTCGLDPTGKKEIYRMIDRLKNRGTSTIFISHDYDEILNICDRVLYLNEGKILFDGLPADLLKSDCFNLSNSYKPTLLKLKEQLFACGFEVKFEDFNLDKIAEAVHAKLSINRREVQTEIF